MKTTRLSMRIGLIAVTLCTVPAYADIETYVLDHSNTFAGVSNYATVKIDADSSTGIVEFTVETFIQSVYGTVNTSNYGMDSFGLNYSGTGGWVTVLPSGWVQSVNKNQDGFGQFQFTYAPQGSAGDREDPLVFSLQLTDASQATVSNFATPNSYGWFFAAHIAGFTSPLLGEDDEPVGSHWVAGNEPRIPAPGAVVLGAIGFAFVGRARRFLT